MQPQGTEHVRHWQPPRFRFQPDQRQWAMDDFYNASLDGRLNQYTDRLGASLARYEERVWFAILAGRAVPPGCRKRARGRVMALVFEAVCRFSFPFGQPTFADPIVAGVREAMGV